MMWQVLSIILIILPRIIRIRIKDKNPVTRIKEKKEVQVMTPASEFKLTCRSHSELISTNFAANQHEPPWL
jgi:phage terminase small subunit